MRQLLYRSMKKWLLNGSGDVKEMYFRAETDGVSLYVSVGWDNPTAPAYGGVVYLTVTYNGLTRLLDEKTFGQRATLSFPYSDAVKTVHVEGMNMVYDGTACPQGVDFRWKMSSKNTGPQVASSLPGIRHDQMTRISWTVSGPGKHPAVVYGRLYYRKTGETFWRSRNLLSGRPLFGSSCTFLPPPDAAAGSLFCYVLYAGAYPKADTPIEACTALTECISPVYALSDTHDPYAPYAFRYGMPVPGKPLLLSWKHPEAVTFILERSVQAGAFQKVYTGPETSYADLVPETAETVVYRVCAKDKSGVSAYFTGPERRVGGCNLYMGCGGRPVAVQGVYIGQNGKPLPVSAQIAVGGARV